MRSFFTESVFFHTNSSRLMMLTRVDFDYAVLFFDEESRTIGIMLTKNAEEEGVLKLIKREKYSKEDVPGTRYTVNETFVSHFKASGTMVK